MVVVGYIFYVGVVIFIGLLFGAIYLITKSCKDHKLKKFKSEAQKNNKLVMTEQHKANRK